MSRTFRRIMSLVVAVLVVLTLAVVFVRCFGGRRSSSAPGLDIGSGDVVFGGGDSGEERPQPPADGLAVLYGGQTYTGTDGVVSIAVPIDDPASFEVVNAAEDYTVKILPNPEIDYKVGVSYKKDGSESYEYHFRDFGELTQYFGVEKTAEGFTIGRWSDVLRYGDPYDIVWLLVSQIYRPAPPDDAEFGLWALDEHIPCTDEQVCFLLIVESGEEQVQIGLLLV